MKKYDLLYVPNPILKTQCIEVKKINNDIKNIINEMRRIMRDNFGVGLAATQIGENKRIVLCRINNAQVITMINPEIIRHSSEKFVSEEGCLSIPNLTFQVLRYEDITVKYYDQNMKEQSYNTKYVPTNEEFINGSYKQQQSYSYANSAIIQHEIDHLDGILLLDKVKETK